MNRDHHRGVRDRLEADVTVSERILCVDDLGPKLFERMPEGSPRAAMKRQVVQSLRCGEPTHTKAVVLDLLLVRERWCECQHIELEIAERGKAADQILEGRLNAALGPARTGVGADENYAHAVGPLRLVQGGSAQRRRRSARESQPSIGTNE